MKGFLKIMIVLLLCICFSAKSVFALDNLGNITENYASETKYFKTTTFLISTYKFSVKQDISYTEEITKEEYENANTYETNGNATVETTYKKITADIEQRNTNYIYNVTVDWKNMPATRSYDIIAIGFPSSVKTSFTPTFEKTYCTSSTNCNKSTIYNYAYSGKNGVGVVYSLPTGNLYSLSAKISLIMSKNTTSTIITQYAYGDYAHATKDINLSIAKSFTVDTSGIVHNNNSSGNFDAVNTARATWSGTW